MDLEAEPSGCRTARSGGRIRLAAFGLDVTLLRGETLCEALARCVGCLERARGLERVDFETGGAAPREDVAAWCCGYTCGHWLAGLCGPSLAPGVVECIGRLRDHAVQVAIVSIIWEFAVAWFAEIIGADCYVGTRLLDGGIQQFWPANKPVWLAAPARRLGLPMDQAVAVGDSTGDVPMLGAVSHTYYVGDVLPEALRGRALHCRELPSTTLRRGS